MFIREIIPISELLVETYVILIQGKTYKEIGDHLGIGFSGAKTRIDKLYSALKEYKRYDLKVKMTNAEAVDIFYELRLDYLKKTN